ncbi:hypothetical protein BVY01_01760 [bacterium I07]|nr:hypothetical protein BVY01_01760 [bacterium I07]
MRNIIIKRLMIFLLILSTMSVVTMTVAQEMQQAALTRGKFWFSGLPNGIVDKWDNHASRWYDAYPGHYAQNNDVTGGSSGRIWNVAKVEGEFVGWEFRPSRTLGEVRALEQNELIKNYNLVDPTQPEEYMQGVMESYKIGEDNRRHMQYELEGRVMAWGLPKYDDFIIVKCKLTNTDDVTFEDYYYTRYLTVSKPGNPLGTSYDTEYLWETDVSDDIGFIFYDDHTWNPNQTDSTIYIYSPGDVTGDRGDPGNIKIEGSTDTKLYSPHLYAFSFLPDHVTPNKNGEKKVWRTILSGSGSAPFEEKYPGSEQMWNWTTHVDILNREQPKMDWRDAHAVYQPGDLAGSLYERNPRYIYSIGPYNIAPGESIEWMEIWLAGQMDRNITILGGLEATQNFVEEGLKDLKDNWSAAKELIDNNFQVTRDIPPPTPADAPLIGNDNELLVEVSSGTVDGKEVSGVDITWKAVHEGYSDPLTGQADFAGYNVYRSDISVEGPWSLLVSLTLSEAQAISSGGTVTFFQQAPVGVPYRYGVTSIDQDGNESALAGYSHYPVAAAIVPTNNLTSVRVIPNPFRQQSGFRDQSERKRIAFVNIPSKCTIRVYTSALELVRTIEHDGGGEVTWGSAEGRDYMLTDFAMNVMPGIYIYHVESQVDGHVGESTVGKFVVIK